MTIVSIVGVLNHLLTGGAHIVGYLGKLDNTYAVAVVVWRASFFRTPRSCINTGCSPRKVPLSGGETMKSLGESTSFGKKGTLVWNDLFQ